jgi:hypothetical protein
MKKYLNMKTVYGTETVDELNETDFLYFKEFRTELRRLINEYHLAGMQVYISSRCTNEWKNK